MIYYGIVIYNKAIVNSCTYNTLMQCGVSLRSIVIFDNSDNEKYITENVEYSNNKRIIYLGNGKNEGISCAYNNIVSYLEKYANEEDYFVTLDDDTSITHEYIQELSLAVEKNKYKVIIPIVQTDKFILSPSNVTNYGKIIVIKDIKQIKRERMTAINTGACYNLTIFNQLKFNENLFLDCVDHNMFRDIRNCNIDVCVMKKANIFQNYSRNEKPEYSSRLKRYKITTRDVFNYGREYSAYSLFFRLSEFRQALLLTLVYKKSGFIKEYFGVWHKHFGVDK